MDEEQPKKKKKKKPSEWSVLDIFLAIFGLAAIAALTIGGFKAAKWVMATYF